jgi:hypothetical protein
MAACAFEVWHAKIGSVNDLLHRPVELFSKTSSYNCASLAIPGVSRLSFFAGCWMKKNLRSLVGVFLEASSNFLPRDWCDSPAIEFIESLGDLVTPCALTVDIDFRI